MSWQSTVTSGIKTTFEHVGSFTARNGHAPKQLIPAQHRLSSIGGMYLGWQGGDQVRDAAYAENKTAEGEYKEIKSEDVPIILRPIYHTIEWNPYAGDAVNKWKGIAHQAIPAVFAAGGTMLGSALIFQLNGRTAKFNETMRKMKKGQKVTFYEADDAALHTQSDIPTWFAAATAGAGASSMVPILFSAGISERFRAASGVKNNIKNSVGGNLSPSNAHSERMEKVAYYVKLAIRSGGKINREWAEHFVDHSLEPIFGEILKRPGERERAIGIIHNTFQKTYDESWKKGLRGEDLIKAVSDKMKKIMGKTSPIAAGETEFSDGIERFVEDELKYDPTHMKFGNATPELRAATEWLAKITGGRKTSASWVEEYVRSQKQKAATGQATGRA